MTATSPAPRKRRRSRKYSSAPIARVPDEADLGPAMRALNAQQRQFVLELRDGPAGYGSEIRAVRAAGYGRPGSSDLTLRVAASRLLHYPKVQEALREVGGKLIRAETFQCIRNTVAIASDLKHRDCLKANLALLDRGGLAVETVHTVNVNKTSPDMVVIATSEVMERIKLLSLKAGLDPAKQIELTSNRADEHE